MKKISLFTYMAVAAAALSIAMTSCGDELKPYPWAPDNTDTSGDGEGEGARYMESLELELRGAIPSMLNYRKTDGGWAYHEYQYQRSNNIDNYAGYWTYTKNNFQFGPAFPTLYTDDNGYLGGPCNNHLFIQSKNAVLYASEELPLNNGKDSTVIVSRPEWRAVALICQAYLGHELVDFYGTIPFIDWRNNKRTYPLNYQSGPEVYKQIFADLDESIAILKERQPSESDLIRVEGTDTESTITRWRWQYWVKFANSIKLRMAMNMVDYVDPDPVYGPESKPFVAQNIAEEAVADEIGVLQLGDDDIAHHMSTHYCAIYGIAKDWHDIRLNANLENILKHFNNPLLEEWFDPNTYAIKSKRGGVIAPTGIYGVRPGLMTEDNVQPSDAAAASYANFAFLSPRHEYMDQPFLQVAEVLFLRAEGALRNWAMGGTAEQFYRDGITHVMTKYGIEQSKIDTYLNQTNLPMVGYKDYYRPEYDCDGRVTCDVKWNDSDPAELKLEKIITQKWIANFPLGSAAWTNYRRTGYPRLIPVLINNMQGVDTEMQIRRMAYTATPNNATEIAQITELLGGEQTAGTRVFWDINSTTWNKDENGHYVPNNHLN